MVIDMIIKSKIKLTFIACVFTAMFYLILSLPGAAFGADDAAGAYQRYQYDYEQLKKAVESGVGSDVVEKLARKYSDSLNAYKKAAGGAETPPNESYAPAAAAEAAADASGESASQAAASQDPDSLIAGLRWKAQTALLPAGKAEARIELAMALLLHKNDAAGASKLLNEAISLLRTAAVADGAAKLLEKISKLQKAIKLRTELSVKYAAMQQKKKAADAVSWLALPLKAARKAQYYAASISYRKTLAEYCAALEGKNIISAFLSPGENPERLAAPAKIVFILLDGVRQDVFQKLLDEGKLPNIKKIADNGVYIRNGVSVLPSTTGPAYAPFVMGLGPAKSKLSGIRLFDRVTGTYRVYCGTDNAKINDDAAKEFPTIYELLSDKSTLTVFGMVDRGVAKSGVPWIQVAYNKLTKDYNKMDSSLVDRFLKEMSNGIPVFSFISLHSPDSNGHSYGANCEYCQAIIFEDSLVGRIVDHIEASGERGRVSFVISSDHGLASTTRSFDVDAALAEDLKMNAYHSIPRNTIDFNLFKSRFKNDIITAVSGNACVLVYVKKPGASTFADRPSEAELRSYPDRLRKNRVDLIAYFASQPGIRHVLYRGNAGQYFAETSNGKALIKRNAGGFSYSVVSGADPFGYASSPNAAALTDGAFHTADEWLAATGPLDYPDAPNLIADLLDSNCGGDIVLLAAPDYEPWNEGQKGVHGNLSYDQIKVPIIFSGPAFKTGAVIESARTVDVFPTMLRALGREIPAAIDGKIIPGALKY